MSRQAPTEPAVTPVNPTPLHQRMDRRNDPEVARVSHEIFGNVVTDNEMALVRMFQKVTDDTDPLPPSVLVAAIKDAFKM